MPNIALTRKRRLSSFRAMSLGTWRTVGDPSIYGALHLPMDQALAYIDAFRARTGRHLTVTHFTGLAVARALGELPDANAILRLGTIYLRDQVDVFFQVAMQDPETGEIDLSGLTIRQADQKSLSDVLDEFERSAARVRESRDPDKERTRRMFKVLPTWLAAPVLRVLGTLIYTLNLDLRWLGLPKDPFGSAMVTNVGSLGLDEVYAPLVPFSRVPIVLALGQVKAVPQVGPDGQIRVVREVRVGATLDHRVVDGAHCAQLARRLREIFEDPETHLGPLPPA